VLRETGAGRVLGVSSGALITLKAALTLPALEKVVIFEPPLLVDGPAIAASLARLDAALAQGNMASALVTGMLAAQMGPAVFNYIPRRLLEPLTNAAMAAEDKKAAGDSVTMRTLAPTLHYDFQLIAEMEGTLETFKAITAKVLLLGGSKSPAYLKASVDGLARVLANAARVIGSEPATLQLRYLQTLTEIAAEKNSTIVFPLPLELLEGFFKRAPQATPSDGINRNVPGAPTSA
jgi:pimeloyl-ACP methyl ester carboxylesterase